MKLNLQMAKLKAVKLENFLFSIILSQVEVVCFLTNLTNLLSDTIISTIVIIYCVVLPKACPLLVVVIGL